MADVELFILNFNGARFFDDCLQSLLKLDRGGHRVGINVVDNNSSDNSREIVARYPEVRFISLGRNWGYGRGNNLGVCQRLAERRREGLRDPDFVVFLNNDTKVTSSWLVEALETFEQHPKAGVVGSKALFFDRFVEVNVAAAPSIRPSDFGSTDTRVLGVKVRAESRSGNLHWEGPHSKWLGAFPVEPGGARWLAPSCRILLAVRDLLQPSSIKLALEPGHPALDTRVGLECGPHRRELVLRPGHHGYFSVELNPQDYVDIIQNAGSFVTSRCDAGDRLMYRCDRDDGGGDAVEVSAVCGVSMFLRTSLFRSLKGFDERFFAYYEDTDLSLRARLLGYQCWYNPRSVLRHVHCGSGGEYSEYFNTNVSFSHLYFASRFGAAPVWREILGERRRWAREEFNRYLGDNTLVGKPNLRAIARFYKLLPVFLKNRALFQCRQLLGRGIALTDQPPA